MSTNNSQTQPHASTSETPQSAHDDTVHTDISSNPRKKQRRSLGTALITLLLTCLILPTSKSANVTIVPFNSQPGIYFENLGITNIISSEWHIITYYDMNPYWREFAIFNNCTTQLQKLCDLKKERKLCSQTMEHFKHLYMDLSKNNELLLPPPNNSRTRRGAMNIIGNIANSLFGVFDSEYAEKMSQTIANINKNEDFLVTLIKNQTSIIDATANVMKKQEEEITKQFHQLENQIDQLTNHIIGVKEESFEEKLSQLFTSVAIQTMLIASNIHRTQDAILDVIVDTHHGRISPQLIAPAQLKRELFNIKNNLPSNLRFPTTEDDVLKYYNLMTIEGRATEQYIIFKIILPLLTLDDFELFKATPVPVLINNTFVSIRPSFPFLVINLHRDSYYPLTKQDLASCISIAGDKHLCKQDYPMYHKGSTISACEVNFINHLSHSDDCQIMKVGEGPHWIQLHNPNQWIYAVRQKMTINIVCGENVTQAILQGSGILTLGTNCIVKQALITIRGHNVLPSNSRMSYVPSGNLTDFVTPEDLTPVLHHSSNYQPQLAELELIKRQLAQLPKDLPEKIHKNDTHQFFIGYFALFLITSVLIYSTWKRWSVRRPINAKGNTTSENKVVNPDKEETSSFNTNFEA